VNWCPHHPSQYVLHDLLLFSSWLSHFRLSCLSTFITRFLCISIFSWVKCASGGAVVMVPSVCSLHVVLSIIFDGADGTVCWPTWETIHSISGPYYLVFSWGPMYVASWNHVFVGSRFDATWVAASRIRSWLLFGGAVSFLDILPSKTYRWCLPRVHQFSFS
jgi:hypothetical protein